MNGSGDLAPGWNGSMSTVLDEVTSEAIDEKHIRRRVDDWEERLNRLYAMIGDWLPDGWEARRGALVSMHEKLMRKFGVEEKRIPTLELHGLTGEVVRLEPYGLRIIGYNGRVDLKREGRRHIIVDAAENFEEPDWQVARDGQRCDRESVTREWLRRALR